MEDTIIGIYCVKNIINNKLYIGSSIDIDRRFKDHKRLLKGEYHYNIFLQRSWNKYGEGNFIFEIIEILSDDHNLIEREQFYIDKYESYNKNKGYNILKVANTRKGIKHTKETKKKISIAMKNTKFNKTLYMEKNTNIIISKNEMDTILTVKKKNLKKILFILLIQNKRYKTDFNIFHMSYDEMGEVSGLCPTTCNRIALELEELKLITIYRSKKVMYVNGNFYNEKNRYELNIFNDIDLNTVKNDNSIFNVCDKDCISCFNACLCKLYSEKELKKKLPRKQYEQVIQFKKYCA